MLHLHWEKCHPSLCVIVPLPFLTSTHCFRLLAKALFGLLRYQCFLNSYCYWSQINACSLSPWKDFLCLGYHSSARIYSSSWGTGRLNNLRLPSAGSSFWKQLIIHHVVLISPNQHLTRYFWCECGWPFHLDFSELGQRPVWTTHGLCGSLQQLRGPRQHWHFRKPKVSHPLHLLEVVRTASASSSPRGCPWWAGRAGVKPHQDQRSVN